MDDEYIFTRNEFAKMLGITPNAVRMKMRRGHFIDVSKYIKNKWMFKRPHPRQVIRPAPSSLSPVSKHRRRGITRQDSTNYDNIRNPVTARKFKEHNDLPMIAKARRNLGHLADKKLEAFLELADKEHEKILAEKQKKAFEDPFMLSEKARFKKARDRMLIAQDEAECGDYDRRKARKEGDEYY